jgi:protein arginine N-methyltransferase 1
VARQAAQANGFGDRIVHLKAYSRHATLPERVDVVVADQVGNFGFNAGVVEYYADAQARFLKPGGTTIPRRIDLVVGPMEAPALFAQVDFWKGSPAGFDFSSARPLAANTGYQVELPAEGLLADAATVVSLDLARASTAPVQGQAAFRVARPGMLHGVGGWFVAELAPGITMTNSPLAAARIQRRQVFFPVDEAVAVGVGQWIRVEMAIRPEESLVNWTVEVADGAQAPARHRFRHSTWKGMLVDPLDLARTRPDFVPTLNARGEARRTVVDLCDGRRSLADIERQVRSRHPGLFATDDEAATFVAEVVTRYAQ